MFRFLLLRRHFDPLLLSIAMASLVVKLGPEILIFGFFAGVGIYLICGRHRAIRRIDRTYAVWAGLYAAGAVLIGLLHGDLAEEIRWIGYPLYLLLGIFLFPGFVLIKDPLRQLVLGARAGLVLAFVLGGVELLSGPMRIGFGGNAANAALVLALTGVLARITVDRPARYLPNSRLWFYLAGIIILMTGTRSILPVFALSLALDIYGFRWLIARDQMRGAVKKAAIVALVGIVGLGAVGYGLSGVMNERLEYTIADLDAAIEEDEQDMTSLTIRFMLWEKVTRLIVEHPIIGVGGANSMDEIKRDIPKSHGEIFHHFNHVHNFILDELRLRGAVGLILMLAFFGATLGKLFAGGSSDLREATLLFLATLLLYGSMHGLLLADRNMALIAIFIAAALLHLKKEEFWRRIDAPS